MPKPILVFTGDNHLRPTTWVRHPTLYGDAYVAWRQIITYCVDQKLPLALLGDFFDSKRPDSQSVGNYTWATNMMWRAGLHMYYVEGNHDKADPPWCSIDPYPQALGRTEIAGIPFYGLSFTSKDLLPQELANIPPETRVFLAHQAWLEIQRVGHTDGSFSMLPHGLVMLTGDYHVCGTWQGTAANGQQVVAYSPGSTALQALNEPPAKFFGVLFDDLTVEWVPLITRTLISITCDTPAALDELVPQLQVGLPVTNSGYPELAKPIVRVRYNDALPSANLRLIDAAGDKFHLFLEPQHAAPLDITVAADLPTTFESLMSAVTELSGENERLKMDGQRLLRTPTIDELKRIHNACEETYTSRVSTA